jgi:hypothetical protein
VRSMSRDASWTGKTPRVGNGNCRPRPTTGDFCEGRPCGGGKSGSGHVGGGDGGGISSKKRGRGLGTMKSDDGTIDDSDNAGEALCRAGDVEGANMSGDGVVRTVRDRKGRSGSGSVEMGEQSCKLGGTEEGIETGLDLYRGESCGEVFGRGGCFSVAVGGDGWMGNVRSDEGKRHEGAKRALC